MYRGIQLAVVRRRDLKLGYIKGIQLAVEQRREGRSIRAKLLNYTNCEVGDF